MCIIIPLHFHNATFRISFGVRRYAKKVGKRSSKALKRKYQICIILHLNINLTFGFCLFFFPFYLMLYVPQTPTSNKEVLLPGIGQKSCPLHCSTTNVRKAKKIPPAPGNLALNLHFLRFSTTTLKF